MSDDSSRRRGGEYVYEALVAADIDLLIGLPGTQTLPLDRTIERREEIDYVMARHETAIPHVAWGYYETSGSPAATLTVPGPGDTNVMHGLKNALEDCVPIVHVAGDVDPDHRGKGPIHEIEPDTFDTVVKENIVVDSRRELRASVERGIEEALTPPYGPVRLGIPSGFLADEFEAPNATFTPPSTTFDNERAYGRAVEALRTARRPLLLVGGGTRRSPDGPAAVTELARELDAPVASTYKGKGVFPESDPRFVGVTGAMLPAGAEGLFDRADVLLAVGTDLDGVSTKYWSLEMGETLVHVNVDPADIGAGYDADVAVVDDAGRAATRLLEGLRSDERFGSRDAWSGASVGAAVTEEYHDRLRSENVLAESTPARTPAVLRALREELPDETIVTTDVGGFRLWAFEVFETDAPERYVSAGSWAGMGVGLPAAVGAKLANPDRPVVALTGDGGLMMCIHELHTAVEEDLDVVVVVFNNGDYGTISKSPEIREYTEGNRFTWESPRFERIAEGFGCRATAVQSPSALRDAVRGALSRAEGPELVDVSIATDELSAKEAATYDSTVVPDS